MLCSKLKGIDAEETKAQIGGARVEWLEIRVAPQPKGAHSPSYEAQGQPVLREDADNSSPAWQEARKRHL